MTLDAARIFISRRLPGNSVEPLLQAGYLVDMYEHDTRCPRDEFLARCADSDALMVQATDVVDREVFTRATRLKVIACCSSGFDHVDLAAARSRNVIICNAPADGLIACTAEAAVGLLLSVAKRITRLHIGQQAGTLPPYSFSEPMGLPLRNRVCGIVGLGRIGAAIAKIMHGGFDNSILYFNRSAKPDLETSLGATRRTLDTVLSESDFIFIVVPLSPETRNLIGAAELQHLKKNAIVVNIARAGIIDDAALTNLLDENRLFGAGLDVYEPVATECNHPNLILTAHMANGENEAGLEVLSLAVDNVRAVLEGEPPVTPVPG
jgi:glyoxylate reductase